MSIRDIKSAQDLLQSDVVKDYIDICPHCGAKAHLKMIYNDYYTSGNDLVFFINFKCVPCKKLILKTFKFEQNNLGVYEIIGWQDKFPTEELIYLNKFENIVPDSVLLDFKEGVVSLNNKCYKAAVSMFRRSLQSALLDMGSNSEEDLITQIRNINNINNELKDWAHSIRIFGNWGAHPQNDNLRDVNEEIGDEVKMFLENLLHYVYVMPSRVKDSRSKIKNGTSKK